MAIASIEFPDGPQWTMWSDWAGCDHLDHAKFCEFPSNYLAGAVRYRECRLQVDFFQFS